MAKFSNFSLLEEALLAVHKLGSTTGVGKAHIWWPRGSSQSGIGLDSEGRYFIIFSSPVGIESPTLGKIRIQRKELDTKNKSVWYALYIPKFDQSAETAAFLYAELEKNNLSDDPKKALESCYELVLALTESDTVSRSAIVGLVGELFLLKSLATNFGAVRAIDCWYGYTQSNRDFNFEGCGVEVKTTLLPQSLHTISSVKQVSLGFADTSSNEKRLYLASIGLRPLATENSGTFSLRTLIREIMSRLTNQDDAARFATNVLEYLGHEYTSVEKFYDTLNGIEITGQMYEIYFMRTYDILDENIKIIRVQDTAEFAMILGSTVSYKIHLPNMIDKNNPVNGSEESVRLILGKF